MRDRPARRLPEPPDPAKSSSPFDLMAGLRRHRALRGLTLEAVVDLLATLRAGTKRFSGKSSVYRYGFVDDHESWPDDDLVLDLATVVFDEPSYVERWRERWFVLKDLMYAENAVSVSTALPDEVPDMVGRHELIQQLLGILTGAPSEACGVALVGFPGIGKTSVMINTAWTVSRSQSFDQVLFVDLRGVPKDSMNPPVASAAVLEKFLRALKVRKIPAGLAERAAAFRECSHHRRLLVLLDNAASREQIEPLLPDGPSCVTLISSRHRLTAVPGVTEIELGVLRRDDALALLRDACPVRFDDDPDAAKLTVRLLRHHPLALRAVAARMRSKADWSLDDHMRQLARTLLDVAYGTARADIEERLAGGERGNGTVMGLHRSVVAEIDLSYATLDQQAQRLLCLMAEHPGRDLTIAAAAAMAGTDVRAARNHLHTLLEINLVVRRIAGRFELHDLVASYAADRAEDDVSPSQRNDAIDRTMRYYLESVRRAVDGTALEGDRHAATAWLAAELRNLIIATVRAARNPAVSCLAHDIALGLEPYLRAEARHHDAVAVHEAAMHASRTCAHQAAHGAALNAAGRTHRQLGNLGHSIALHQQALKIYQTDGDLLGQARTLNKLGLALRAQGNHQAASQRHQQAADLLRDADEPRELQLCLGNLGVTYDLSGHLDDAIRCYEQVIRLARALGDEVPVGKALCDIATIHKRRLDLDIAIDYYQRARQILVRHRDRTAEATCVENLGSAHLLAGRPDVALTMLTEALQMRERSGEVDKLSNTHHDLALTHLARNDPTCAAQHVNRAYDLAVTHGLATAHCRAANARGELHQHKGDYKAAALSYREALQLAVDAGNPDEQARAHVGLAAAYEPVPDSCDAAISHLRQALALYTRMRVPEQHAVQQRLDELTQTAGQTAPTDSGDTGDDPHEN